MRTSYENNQLSPHKSSTSVSRLLEIRREFNVSVERLFQAFTSAENLKNWWWPKGLYADHIEYEFREGGRYFINIKGGSNMNGGGMTGHFEKIHENKLIVMTDQFADASGRVISAKDAAMPGLWPEIIYITFDFVSTNGGNSRLIMAQENIPNEMQKDCRQGWSESFNKLDNYLSDEKN